MRQCKRGVIATVLLVVMGVSTSAFADGVVRGKITRLSGVGAGNTTPKVEIGVAPESSSALPNGTGNCQTPPSQAVTLYLMPTNPSYKSILAILLTAAATKKMVGLDALMDNKSCQVQNGYGEF
ncbi:MAG: hypothetical protein HYV03_06155 [Deltaproteobacteria bacterium]|nr:hypothetical protein [Deltaproteobacteria bacterium]